jgi:hypothetical protein
VGAEKTLERARAGSRNLRFADVDRYNLKLDREQ